MTIQAIKIHLKILIKNSTYIYVNYFILLITNDWLNIKYFIKIFYCNYKKDIIITNIVKN